VRRFPFAVLSWEWPAESRDAVVHWRLGTGQSAQTGSARCARHTYENEGGFTLRVDASEAEFTVEALVPGATPDSAPPSMVRLPAPPPKVTYDFAVSGRRRHRVVRLTLTSAEDCALPDITVVHAAGRYLPSGRHEGRAVYRVAGRDLRRNLPACVEFPLPADCGPGWLVCFPEESAQQVDLQPVSLHRLKVA
jgi:hypothetical protein